MFLHTNRTHVLFFQKKWNEEGKAVRRKAASRFLDTPFQNVMKCDVYVRKELYATFVVSGGTALFQGIIVHMTKELTALAPFTREHLHCHRRREIVPFVKEKLCYIACVFDTELKSIADTDREKTYELPDGKHHHCRR